MSPNSGVVGVDWGPVGRHLPKVEDGVVLKTRGVNGVKTGQKFLFTLCQDTKDIWEQ